MPEKIKDAIKRRKRKMDTIKPAELLAQPFEGVWKKYQAVRGDKFCTAAPVNPETNDYQQCKAPALYSAQEADDDGTYQWRGDYCYPHLGTEGEAHPAWEFWVISH